MTGQNPRRRFRKPGTFSPGWNKSNAAGSRPVDVAQPPPAWIGIPCKQLNVGAETKFLPDLMLRDQNGGRVRFYTDLIKDKVMPISFLVWRDLTMAGPWNVVSWQPPPNTGDYAWSNTIPSSNRCHTYSAYVNYSGVQSPVFTYNGLSAGYCTESARVIWIQPQSTAGFGPPGSLVVAGSATNAPSGTQVYLWYRDITAGTGLIRLDFAPLPGSDGVWYNAIENANPFHQYEVYATYDVFTSRTCTYAGNNSPTSCP